jgi:enoyl-CoA hydratase/carnithine racemase
MSTIDTFNDNGVLWVRMNRPEALNAYSEALGDDLEAAIRAASLDDAVGAIIVTGNGPAFCAGADLTREGNVFALDETARPTFEDLDERLDDPAIVSGVRDKGGRLALAIHQCRKPIIAAINGAAVGVGATMTLAMDFRLASSEARLGFVFARLGLVPEACSTWFLPRLVGLQQALEWCLTGDLITPEEALKAGLLRSVHAPEDLLAAAEALARRLITGKSPVAVALTRRMLRGGLAASDPLEAHKVETLAMFHLSQGDGREGVAAFMAKRKPAFTGQASDLGAAEAILDRLD